MPHSDDTSSQSRVVAAALESADKLQPPNHMFVTENDMHYYRHILLELPVSEWTQHKIQLAVLLARAMADLDDYQNLLRREGCTIPGARGPVPNPVMRALALHAGQVDKLRRMLRLTTAEESASLGKSRAVTRKIEGDAVDIVEESDGLIARPFN